VQDHGMAREPAAPDLMHAIAAVRRFNRFYTRELGLLRKTFLGTAWTLGEMRVLFEISRTNALTARDVARSLDLDAAYLSRMLARFEADGLIKRMPSRADARQLQLSLTPTGVKVLERADALQAAQTTTMLKGLSPAERKRLADAMATIEDLLRQSQQSGKDSAA
jgi:DNA-binding MarR family transcriptional regulator